MSLSKPLTLRHLCHLLNNILGLFYHCHIVFFTISLVKNNKCYLPKNSVPEWPRNKLLATTCQVPQCQAGNRSSPSWVRTPQPWPLQHRHNGRTATLSSFYLIGVLHSETDAKELAAEPGIDLRPLGLEHHSTTVIFLFYLTLFLHSWANLL